MCILQFEGEKFNLSDFYSKKAILKRFATDIIERRYNVSVIIYSS